MSCKKFLLVLLLVARIQSANSQKSIKGAYEGELLTPKNVLILEQTKDTLIRGQVYLNQFDHFPFFGYIKENKIRGTIMAPPGFGDTQIFMGRVGRDTIYSTVTSSIDSSVIVQSTLLKVSSSPNYNIEKSFGKVDLQFDPTLVGAWRFLFSLKPGGDTIKTKMQDVIVEYFPNGMWQFQSPLLDQLKAKQGPNQVVDQRMTWATYQDKLTTKVQTHIPATVKEKATAAGYPLPEESFESITTYRIHNDTLMQIQKNENRSYYLRKR